VSPARCDTDFAGIPGGPAAECRAGACRLGYSRQPGSL